MSTDRLLEEFPGIEEEDPPLPEVPTTQEMVSAGRGNQSSWMLSVWEQISGAGLGELVLRVSASLFTLLLVLVSIWAMQFFYRYVETTRTGSADSSAKVNALVLSNQAFAAEPTATAEQSKPVLPPYHSGLIISAGITRMIVLETIIPSRPRTELSTYTVQAGDTIFGIAEKFGLKPETILWGNTYTLGDDPHRLTPGMELTILPVNGVYHKWSAGEGLNGVARGYNVSPEEIINWSGNNLTVESVGNFSNPNIEPGTMLVIPGGSRGFITWSAPLISRKNPAVARLLGPGACGVVVDGAVGIGTFVWPTTQRTLSGYDYSSIHPAIDIGGANGNAIYAADNGVVVYAGWNNYGYGNVVVIDHGTGWQTLYAHMSSIGVSCGQSVYQGGQIGGVGSTGNSTGPHLHFELMHSSYGKVNPWDFLR